MFTGGVIILINREDIIEILKCEVVPALGCTEPVAVALACAAAAFGEGLIKFINVVVSPNIYKNGMSVGIPGIKEKGIKAAACIGAVAGDYKLGLQVLNSISEKYMDEYYRLLNNNNVEVEVSSNGENLYIEACVETEQGRGKCIIRGSHSNIVYIEHDGKVLLNKLEDCQTNLNPSNREKLKDVKISEIINTIDSIEPSKIEFLMDGVEMNLKAAEYGLKERPGMAIGASMLDAIKKGLLSDDIYHEVQLYTAAASDARMAGRFIPVMSSAGSGNQGLTAIIPVAVAGKRLKCEKEKIIKALAISHIITIYIKNYTGRLSAICGCGVAASTGASAAIAYLMNGSISDIEGAINNMVADVSGMICDGAKPGCALKLSTASGAAVNSAILSVNKCTVPCSNGIVGYTCEDSIKNLGRVSAQGMVETDRVILQTMIDKNAC